ncbi:MAG TPA: pyruvate:ferredoxin (flavodoxin) oxidoreductase, partial [Candidatus Xenobia bacterium]
SPDTVSAVFYGLGSDGTVGANKNSIKIIGDETNLQAQGYFVYDSKKSGSVTVSHLRFGPNPIRSSYLIDRANFVACHQFSFLNQMDVLAVAAPGARFLLNSPHPRDTAWGMMPGTVRHQIVEKGLKLYVIDALQVARSAGMGARINTVMQTCFFALSGVMPRDEAIAAIKRTIEKTYGKRGEGVVRKNFDAVDAALAHLFEVSVPASDGNGHVPIERVSTDAPRFVREVTARLLAGQGDSLPVSALPVDGTWPCSTARYEKRNISPDLPIWDESLCIQCGKCVIVCPHSVLRAKVYPKEVVADAPPGFKSVPARWKERQDEGYTLQVAPEDCTGCTLCIEVCPVKDKSNATRRAINMAPQVEHVEVERRSWEFFQTLPEPPREELHPAVIKDVQLLQPLFEFSGACSGCGETPYVRLLSQLFGDRAVIANATGCSSIYGGNLPTTPWSTNPDGRGPAWSNSLFEDNAEFGLGFRLTADQLQGRALQLLGGFRSILGDALVNDLTAGATAHDDAGIKAQRDRVARLREKLAGSVEAKELLSLADRLVYTSVWIVGGDGWAYDIGYGGLDHVLASGRNVNVLVLDTEVYSNTGGQSSKSTPMGAVAKFAAGGKRQSKKDLAMLAMAYRHVYVATIAMGSNDTQTVRAFLEAEAYPGPSLIIAYAHCIAHGYDMAHGLSQQKAAVACGHWPLLRWHPEAQRLDLDSKAPSLPLSAYTSRETRYSLLSHLSPEQADQVMADAQEAIQARWASYEKLANEVRT